MLVQVHRVGDACLETGDPGDISGRDTMSASRHTDISKAIYPVVRVNSRPAFSPSIITTPGTSSNNSLKSGRDDLIQYASERPSLVKRDGLFARDPLDVIQQLKK